jgi:hypothetical protein
MAPPTARVLFGGGAPQPLGGDNVVNAWLTHREKLQVSVFIDIFGLDPITQAFYVAWAVVRALGATAAAARSRSVGVRC